MARTGTASEAAPRVLRVLLIEDSEDDALLLVADLEAAGYAVTWQRVDDAAAMERALAQHTWDVVISDEAMPRFSAAAALGRLQARGLDLPFVIVSGTISEERAVAAMKAGAHDYFIKGNHSRLVPAIEREVREAAQRRAGREAEAALRRAEAGRLVQQAKEELIATVSHELRTPLATILAAAELLEGGEVPEAKRGQVLGVLLAEGRRLRSLIDNFLSLQRVESGWHVPTLAPADLRPLLEQAARDAGDDSLRPIVVDTPVYLPLVLVDGAQLLHVLGNLLANARKYSPEGGTIHLRARTVWGSAPSRVVTAPARSDAAGSEPPLVEVSVRDHGIGIAPAHLPHLFEKFYRAENGVRRSIPGTGLGLAICQKIVVAHGGRIWAESAGPGQGSTFVFTLPTTAPRSEVPLTPTTQRGAVRVEDG